MNKQGQGSLISGIILVVVAITLITGLAFPIIKPVVQAQTETEDVIKAGAIGVAQNVSLTYDDLVSLTITGLTDGLNYSVDLTTGVILFNATAAGTYSASYDYYADNYLTNTSQRMLFSILGLALILGILYFLFSLFGLV